MEEQPVIASSAQTAINALATNRDLTSQKVNAIIDAVSAPVITRLERFCTRGHLDGLKAIGYNVIIPGVLVKTDHENARTTFIKVKATLGKFHKVEIISAGHIETKLDEIPDDTKLRGHLTNMQFAEILRDCHYAKPGRVDFEKFPYLGWSELYIACGTEHFSMHDGRNSAGVFIVGPDWVIYVKDSRDGPVGSDGREHWVTYGRLFLKSKPAITDGEAEGIVQMSANMCSDDWIETIKTKTLEELFLMSLDWRKERELEKQQKEDARKAWQIKTDEEKRLKREKAEADAAARKQKKEDDEASKRFIIAVAAFACLGGLLYLIFGRH